MDKEICRGFAGSRFAVRSVRRSRPLGADDALGAAAASHSSQQPQQQPPQAQQAQPGQTPTFRSGVELVTVDVGVVDRQGQPMRGLTAGDFTVTVAGQPRRVVNAEFVDSLAETSRSNLRRSSLESMISTNEGASIGRMFVFVVDQGTLEAGNVRHVGQAASRFLATLSFADRSALMLLPSGPNVTFTWAHDKVRDGARPGDWPGRPRQRVRVRQPDGSARNLQPQPHRPSHRRAARVRQRRGGIGRIRRVQRRFRRPRRPVGAVGRRRRRKAARAPVAAGRAAAAAPAAPAAPRDRRVARAPGQRSAAAEDSAAAAPGTCRCAPSGRGAACR